MNTKAVAEAGMPPDGSYRGEWGGYQAKCDVGGETFKFKTEVGIRTPRAEAVISVFHGEVVVTTV